MNHRIYKTITVAIIAIFIQKSLPAQEYSISGTIKNIKKETGDTESTLYVYLLTEETFEKPYTGIKEIKLQVNRGESRRSYTIKNVKKGTYGLRCFQDMNDNGKLDRFLILPTEPWCLSWRNDSKRVPPKFEDIAFKVKGDTQIDLNLDQ